MVQRTNVVHCNIGSFAAEGGRASIESKAADRPREGSREAAFSFRTVGKQGAD